jgi:hypothetical protein
MLQSSTPSSSSADKDDTRTTVSLSQLRVKICSVRLPSSTKLVDICVIMEVDNKYTYRTEIIRKKDKTNINSPIIPINESFDILVTLNSKIKLKILAPTRLFGNHDIGQFQFAIKTIIDDYHSSEQITNNNNNDINPSYLVKFPFENSTTSSSIFRSNDTNNVSNGIVEIIFYGSLLKQQQQQQNENRIQQVRKYFYDFNQ